MALKVHLPELRNGSALDIRDPTKAIGGGTFGFVYEQRNDAKRLERLEEEMTEYTVGKFVDFTTLWTYSLELNNQLKERLQERDGEGQK